MDQSALTGATDMSNVDNSSICIGNRDRDRNGELDRIDKVVYEVGERE